MRGLSERAVLSYTQVDLTELALKLDVFLSLLLDRDLFSSPTRDVYGKWLQTVRAAKDAE